MRVDLSVREMPLTASQRKALMPNFSPPGPDRVPNNTNSAGISDPRNPGSLAFLKPEGVRQQLESLLENINRTVETVNKRLSFRVHEGTDRVMVQIIDIETQQVIKEMPPEELLDLLQRIRDMVGLLFDQLV